VKEVTTTKEQPRTRQPKISRCSECGFSVYRWEAKQACPKHHQVEGCTLIPWTTKLGIAMGYVERIARLGGNLERWIEEANPDYYPGTTRGDMALALTYARKWRIIDEGNDLPSTATPRGLFG